MKRTYSVLIALFFLISGCGSDGSDPVAAPDPTLEITSNNALLIANIAYSAALESQQLGDSGGGVFIGSASGGVTKIAGDLVSAAKTGTGNSGAQIPIPAETIPCAVEGTMTISGEIADIVTPTLSAGDYFQYEYSGCDDGLGEVKNGTVRTDIDAFSGDLNTGLFSMTMTNTLTNFQVSIFENQSTTATEVVTSNGGATLTIDATSWPFLSYSVSGNSLVVDTLSSSESLVNFASTFTVDGNVVTSPYTHSSSGTLDSTQLAGVIRYSNSVTFAGLGIDYPGSGEFLVEGLASSLRLFAEDNVNVRIEIDLGADGTIDETINTTWTLLDASQ